jgi:hypothetical protein
VSFPRARCGTQLAACGWPGSCHGNWPTVKQPRRRTHTELKAGHRQAHGFYKTLGSATQQIRHQKNRCAFCAETIERVFTRCRVSQQALQFAEVITGANIANTHLSLTFALDANSLRTSISSPSASQNSTSLTKSLQFRKRQTRFSQDSFHLYTYTEVECRRWP